MRKKVIKGIVLVVALIVAVLLLRGCGKEETVPEMTWSQADRPVYAYEEAKARYIWSAYEGEEKQFAADITALPVGDKEPAAASKTTVPYVKEMAVSLEQSGVYTLSVAYKNAQAAATAAPAEGAEASGAVVLDTVVTITVDGRTPAECLNAYVLPASASRTEAVLVDAEGQPLQFRLGGGKHVVSVKAEKGGVEAYTATATAVQTYNDQTTVTVEEGGLYALSIEYVSDAEYADGAAITLQVDGGVPFAEAAGYALPAAAEATSHVLADANGVPYLFSFGPGEHVITLSAAQGGVQVTGVKLFSTAVPVYAGENIAFPAQMNLVLDHSDESVGMGEVTIEAPEHARYEIWLTYRNTTETTLPSELAIVIDGQPSTEELQRVKLSSKWVDDGVFSTDRYGNEIATTPHAAEGLQESAICDSAGRTVAPLLFELTAGTHTLFFDLQDGGCEITEVSLRKPAEIAAYAPGDASGDGLIVIEAENIASRNESSIRGAGEFNARLSPYSNDFREINFLDGASFDEAGEMVTWKINVEKSGWYYLGAYYRQSARADYPTYVDVLIDGQIPSAAAQRIAFPYTTSFTTMQATGADGAPLAFYLEAGEREISFRINADHLTPVYKTIDVMLEDINAMSNEIKELMGGAAADKFRDYKIEKNFPHVRGQLAGWAQDCTNMVAYASQFADDGKASAFNSMTLCADQLSRLSEEPEDLPRRMSEFSTGANSAARMLAQQLTDMANNDLSIDQIYFYQADAKLPEKPGFFENTWAGVQRFFTSFTAQDYAATSAKDTVWVDEESGEEHPVVQVWVGRSRQYVELMQQMADTKFFEETGIRVNLSLMPDANKLVLANAAGTAPDAVVGLQYVVPSYLNIRGALYDLAQIDDIQNADGTVTPGFGAVAQRFSSGLFIPYTLEEGVYAMPETVNFWVMFYRKDIVESLSIPIPDSMDDVREILPELERRSMKFYFPTAGMVGMKVFPGTLPLLLQAGGSIYADTIGETTLDSDVSLQGFRELTELFTVYNMPTDVPSPGFYQQFRDGTMPMGIADLATYNLLLNAAPELDGLWDIALFPGLKNDAGEVQRWTTGGAETMAIMSAAEDHGNVDAAWRFLEWWSRAETQAEFGDKLQSTYGSEYIWPTANTEAFAQLPLRAAHKEVIIEQMQWMTEAPWVLGTYMLERELSNAFISVTADGVEARRAMDTAVKRIDRETFRKLEEFGFYEDGEMVRELRTPSVQVVLDIINEYNSTHEAADGVQTTNEEPETPAEPDASAELEGGENE